MSISSFQSTEITPLSSRQWYFMSQVLQYWSKLLLKTCLNGVIYLWVGFSRPGRSTAAAQNAVQLQHRGTCARKRGWLRARVRLRREGSEAFHVKAVGTQPGIVTYLT